MAESRHHLVVGGSGMLREVCTALAARGHPVTVIGRRQARLRALVATAAELSGAIHPLPLDYREQAALRQGLEEHQRQYGPIVVAVCWIHGTAPKAPFTVAEVLDGQGVESRFFHLLGSAARDPTRTVDREAHARFAGLRQVAYRQVALGFMTDGRGSRWLTDAEICAGVLAAIDEDAPLHVVGTLRPWELRPR